VFVGFATPAEKSVRISWGQVEAAAPEVLVFMLCGYDLRGILESLKAFKTRNFDRLAWLPATRAGEICAVAGNAYFPRPWPRLVDGLETLAAILCGESFDGLSRRVWRG